MRASTIVSLSALMLVLQACNDRENTTWESERCNIKSMPTLRLPNHQSSPQWVACRALYLKEIDSVPSNLIIEFMTSGTYGTFAEPGAGWLRITISDIDNVGGSVDVVSSSTSAGRPAADIYYEAQSNSGSSGYIYPGSLNINNLNLEPHGTGDSSSTFDMDFDLDAHTDDGAASVTGGFSCYAPEPVTDTSGPTGDSGPGCNSNACDSYSAQCNGYTQAPCYCAAACLCHCNNQPSCEQSNRNTAQQLGLICQY